jgi:hypothetical protein
MFWKNIATQSSELKNRPQNKPVEAGGELSKTCGKSGLI